MTMPLSATDVAEFKELARQVVANNPPPTFAYLQTSSIRIDGEYQRDLQQRRVDKMVKEFDPHRFQPVEVSKRADGSLWCIEGQHRLAAARALGMHVVAAMVHEGLSSTDEALLFWLFQRDRRALNAWDSFEARLHGKEPVAVGVDNVVNTLNLTYGRGGQYDIQALTVMEGMYRRGGRELLALTLATIQTIWPMAIRRFDGVVMGGMGTMLHQYGKVEQFDRERLIKVLSVITPSSLLAEVKQARGGLYNIGSDRIDYTTANLMRNIYNRRLGKPRQLPPMRDTAGKRLPKLGS